MLRRINRNTKTNTQCSQQIYVPRISTGKLEFKFRNYLSNEIKLENKSVQDERNFLLLIPKTSKEDA